MSDQNPAPSSFPVSPPRVRVEWLIAGVRVAIAVSALLAFLIDVPNYFPPYVVSLIFSVYLIYGLAVVALVWSPVNFGRGWDLAVHLFENRSFVGPVILPVPVVVRREVSLPYCTCATR